MNEYYTQEQHGPYELYLIEEFDLFHGQCLKNVKLAYQTYGQLNAKGDNAILFPVMFSGTSGSLKHYIGQGLALDLEKYFIVVPDQLGNGLSSSPNNTAAPHSKSNFPKLDITDDVRAQKKLCDHLGINSLELVMGWSMGAQQTYEWAIRYPEMVKRIAPIAGTAVCTPHDQLYVDVFCEALRSDPQWLNGEYQDSHEVSNGLNRLAKVFALMGLCTEFYQQEKWTSVGFNSKQEFLEGFWQAWFAPMDPNVLLCMAEKWKHGDSSRDYDGNIEKALSRIKAKTVVIAFKEDMFIPVRDCQDEQEKINNSELVIIDSLWGHFTMMGIDENDFKAINQTIEKLLACD